MIDLDKMTRPLLKTAESFDKKGWLNYILIGLILLLAWALFKGCF